MSRRYRAQRALTREWLGSIPLITNGAEHELSGPGSLVGTLAPDIGAFRTDDGHLLLEEWGTLIHEEVDGEVRWSGIVISSGFAGREWTVECAGLTTYPVGTPWTGKISSPGIDPIDVFRQIWAEVQSQPDSNLGVSVVGATKTDTLLGTAEDPYELFWWNTPDCGSEIDTLAKEGPFDYAERHYYDGEDVVHEVVVGYPRLGRRRTDLAFVQGVNITANVNPGISGDDRANAIIGIGAGEGEAGLRRTTAATDGRLRRTKVLARKDVTQNDRMDALIRDELQRTQAVATVDSIQVTDHPNAVFGSWQLGDDILISGTLPWLGKINLWHRIVGWSPTGPTTATIKLEPSDSFTYGGQP